MSTYTDRPPAMKTLRLLVVLAVVATGVAAAAGIWFWIADPAEGSTLYDSLGPTAAFGGLAAGALFAAAAIYAQVKSLWTYLPTWIRITVMGLVLIGVVVSIVSWVQA